MKYTWDIGKVSGIKIAVHWTFLILIAWVILGNMRGGANLDEISWSVGFVLSVFVCVILHELGHALAAQRFGIETREITILPIGGVAQLESIPEDPKKELIVAIAGPVVNFILAAVFYLFIRSSMAGDELGTIQKINAQNFLPALMSVNLWLGLFNLIPAFPMDGGRILRALLAIKLKHAQATRIAASIGQIFAIAFVFFGFIYSPIMILIGFFIFLGAQSEAFYSQHRFALQGYTVNDVVMHDVAALDENASLKDAVLKLLDTQNKNFLIVKDGYPVGTLNREQIINGIVESGESVSVGKIKDPDLLFLEPSMQLEKAWQLMKQNKKYLMPVMVNEKLIGVVDDENIAEFVLIRIAEKKKET